ncbi:MAG TPA: insulinase family protein [Verrucomicrobiales bacterium]|nr:insulinase family protein [Verrucomicrobiales bacterium]
MITGFVNVDNHSTKSGVFGIWRAVIIMSASASACLLVVASLSSAVPAETDREQVPASIPQAESIDSMGRLFSDIETYHFNNGFKLWVKPVATDPYVRITLTLNAGGCRTHWVNQVRHTMEHLLFESLPHRQEIADLKQMGAVMNGHTSIDRMAFYIDVPKVHWKKAVLLIYKMVFKPKFTKASVNSERVPILAELKYRFQNSHEWLRLRSPFNADLDKDYWRREFNLDLNFRSLIGNEAQVRSMTLDDIGRYYARNFLPDRMTLTVIGDVHVVDLRNQVDSTFGQKNRVLTDVQSVGSDPPSRIKEVVS